MKHLFHYTSMEGLQKILTGQLTHPEVEPNSLHSMKQIVFHATHIQYMNDMMEYVYFKDLLWKAVKDRGVSYESYENFINKVLIFSDPFVLSFSENREFLPMWQMYGNMATGVMLVFDKEKLSSTFHSLEFCQYADNLEEDYIEACIDSINRCSIPDTLLDIKGIKKNMSLYKSPHYEYEKEWRIYKRSNIVYTKVSNGIIKPYIEIAIPIDCLDEVVIGPCVSNKEQVIKAIEILLDRKITNKKIKVRQSEINSYRNI